MCSERTSNLVTTWFLIRIAGWQLMLLTLEWSVLPLTRSMPWSLTNGQRGLSILWLLLSFWRSWFPWETWWLCYCSPVIFCCFTCHWSVAATVQQTSDSMLPSFSITSHHMFIFIMKRLCCSYSSTSCLVVALHEREQASECDLLQHRILTVYITLGSQSVERYLFLNEFFKEWREPAIFTTGKQSW